MELHLFGSTYCFMFVALLFAAGAGMLGAKKAKNEGTPAKGPMVLAGSLGVLALGALGFLALMLVTPTMVRFDLLPLPMVLALLLRLVQVAGMLGVAAGLWMLRPAGPSSGSPT